MKLQAKLTMDNKDKYMKLLSRSLDDLEELERQRVRVVGTIYLDETCKITNK